MTTLATSTAAAPHRATLADVVRSEWTKFWSVRSTAWTLLLVVVLTVGFGALFTWGTESSVEHLPPEALADFDAASTSLAGLMFAQLAVAVLGVLVISSEYSTGGIRTSLTAVPKRMRLLAAKAIVLIVVSWIVGTVTSFLAFFIGQAILGIADLDTGIGDPDVLRAVLGGGLYVVASAMFGFALGALLRHTAGAVTIAVAMLLVIPPFLALLPGEWGKTIFHYFTSNAGQQITYVHQADGVLSPWTGYLVFTLWWVVILAVAAWLMNRRDA